MALFSKNDDGHGRLAAHRTTMTTVRSVSPSSRIRLKGRYPKATSPRMRRVGSARIASTIRRSEPGSGSLCEPSSFPSVPRIRDETCRDAQAGVRAAMGWRSAETKPRAEQDQNNQREDHGTSEINAHRREHPTPETTSASVESRHSRSVVRLVANGLHLIASLCLGAVPLAAITSPVKDLTWPRHPARVTDVTSAVSILNTARASGSL